MTLRAPVAFSFRHPALSLWRCYALGIRRSSGGGFRNLPRHSSRRAGAYRCPSLFFITVHALLMSNNSVIGSSSAFGHIRLLASFGRVALVGLLRPVCCRARHHARSLRRSRYARQSGIGLRPHFLSAGALCCGSLFAWFPYVVSTT